MPEWPDGVLAGLDAPRPLPAGLRSRLEQALLDLANVQPSSEASEQPGSEANKQLGNDLSSRLEQVLTDPVAIALVGIDEPRPLPGSVRDAVETKLAGARRPRTRAIAMGAAAALLLLAGSSIAISTGGGPQRTQRALNGFGGSGGEATSSEGAPRGAGGGSAEPAPPGVSSGKFVPGTPPQSFPGSPGRVGATAGSSGRGGSTGYGGGGAAAGPAGPVRSCGSGSTSSSSNAASSGGAGGVTPNPAPSPSPPGAASPNSPGAGSPGPGAQACPAPPGVYGVSPDGGPTTGGTGVDIEGSSLWGSRQVYFGTSPAKSFEVRSQSDIWAITPPAAHTGTSDVSVVAASGARYTLQGGFTYEDAPSVASVSPSSGPESGGTTVTITGNWFAGTISVRFGNTQAATFTVVSLDRLEVTAPGGMPGPVHVTVVTPAGTSETTLDDLYTYTP